MRLYTSRNAVSALLRFSTAALKRLTRVESFVTTLVAVLSLLSLTWAGYWMIRLPYFGFDWTVGTSVRTIDVDPTGPAAGKIAEDEELLVINGLPTDRFIHEVGLIDVGTSWTFTLRSHDGRVHTETIISQSANSVGQLFDRFASLFISLVFWLSGLIVIALTIRTGPERLIARLYFAFCQMVVLYIASGEISFALPELGSRLLLVAGAGLGAVAIDLHLRFPFSWPRWPLLRFGTAVPYAVLVIAAFTAVLVSDPYEIVQLAGKSSTWLATCLAVVIVILASALMKRGEAKSIFQVRLVASAALLSLLSALLFTVLPIAVGNSGDVIPVYASLAFMLLIPVGYAYAILRYRLLRYDGTVSRAIGYVVAIVLLVVVLAVMVMALLAFRLLPVGTGFIAAVVALTVVLAVAFEPARHRIQQVVDRTFERPWVEFRTTLLSVDQTLAGTPDVSAWATVVCNQFSTALDVMPFGLLYRAPGETRFRLAAHDPVGLTVTLPRGLAAGLPLSDWLNRLDRPARRRDLRLALDKVAVSDTERAWLTTQSFDLWWPIRSHGQLRAVMLVGQRSTTFTNAEIELLALASHQIGVALENAEFTSELEQLSRAALQTRDDERRRVSRELHDHIIQPLVGLNFSLATVRDVPETTEARKQISELITDVRQISSELRPPALDEVGLGAAARGLVRTFMRTSGLDVRFVILPNEDIEVPEPIASTYYAALREALSNIQRHSKATRVSVLLEAAPERLSLVIHDDGVGFTPPERLGRLASDGRFGLLGVQERMTAIGGSLAIQSGPGQGTRVECQTPS